MSVAVLRVAASRWVTAAILLHMCSLLPVFVTERYRLAAVPGLMLFAGYGLWLLFESCRDRKLGILLAYLALLIPATLFVLWPQRDSSLWALDAYNSGILALETNELERAEQKLSLAYRYVPENAETNFALGNLRLAQGRRAEATRYYEATLGLRPDHSGALNNLRLVSLEAGDLPAAERFFRAALARDPENAKTHYLLAQALLGLGDRPAARDHAERAVELAPERPEFRTFLGQLGAAAH